MDYTTLYCNKYADTYEHKKESIYNRELICKHILKVFKKYFPATCDSRQGIEMSVFEEILAFIRLKYKFNYTQFVCSKPYKVQGHYVNKVIANIESVDCKGVVRYVTVSGDCHEVLIEKVICAMLNMIKTKQSVKIS